MIQNFGIPTGQVSDLPSTSGQIDNSAHESGWAKLVVARSHLAEQCEVACQSLARGNFENAGQQFRALLQVALTQDDAALAEVACHNLATTYRQPGRWLDAECWQQQSLAWRMKQASTSANQSDDELARLASDLTGRGCDAFLKRDWDMAESLWQRALAIEEWRGSWEGRACDLGNLGLLAAARGDLESGKRWLRESLRLHRVMFDDIGVGTDLLNLAELYRLQGDFPRMTRLLRQAAKRFERAEAQGMINQTQRRLKEAARIEAVVRCDPRLN